MTWEGVAGFFIGYSVWVTILTVIDKRLFDKRVGNFTEMLDLTWETHNKFIEQLNNSHKIVFEEQRKEISQLKKILEENTIKEDDNEGTKSTIQSQT